MQVGFRALDPDPAFQSYMEGALASFGIEADDTERAVMAGVWTLYRPGLERLLTADLSSVEAERDPDPSRAPE